MEQYNQSLEDYKKRLDASIKALNCSIFRLESDPKIICYQMYLNKKKMIMNELHHVQKEIQNACHHLWYVLSRNEYELVGKCLKCELEESFDYDEPHNWILDSNCTSQEDHYWKLYREYQESIDGGKEKEFIRRYQKL